MAGAFGHINHIYEDPDITFGDIRNLMISFGNNSIDIFEKYDGQNLMVTYKNNQLCFARNKTTLQNPGTLPLLLNMYNGRDHIQDSFTNAFLDLERMLLDYPNMNHITNFFKEGKVFLNVEVINKNTRNVVYYNNQNFLVLLGAVEISEDGNIVNHIDRESVVFLMNGDSYQGSTYKIIKYDKLDYTVDCSNSITKLNNFMELNKVNDSDKILELVYRKYLDQINKLKLTNLQKASLKDRWLFGNKSVKLNHLNYGLSSYDIGQYEKNMMLIDRDLALLEFKKILIEFTNDIFNSINSKVSDISDVNNVIDLYIQALQYCMTNNIDVNNHLEVIKYFGIHNIKNIEGIVFEFKNKLFKLTGIFAPVNQITGNLKYKR